MNSHTTNRASASKPPVRSGFVLTVACALIGLGATVALVHQSRQAPPETQVEPFVPAAVETPAEKPAPSTLGQRLAAARGRWSADSTPQAPAVRPPAAAAPASNSIFALQAQESAAKARDVIAIRNAAAGMPAAPENTDAESIDPNAPDSIAPNGVAATKPSSALKIAPSDGVNAYREGDRIRRSITEEMRKVRAAAILEARRKEAANQ